jgi:uncharacterized protein
LFTEGDEMITNAITKMIDVMEAGRRVHSEEAGICYVEALSREECVLYLRAHGVGHVCVLRAGRPAIYPVNYILDGDSIVFRTRQESDLYAATFESPAAFEIDGTETIYHEGWSVLVVGQATHVHDSIEIDRLSGARLTSWAGARGCFVKIGVEEVSGCHIGHRVPISTGARETFGSSVP